MSATRFLAEANLPPRRRAPFAERAYRIANQAAALVLLVLFAPIFLVVGFAIWRADGFPVVYSHRRVGRDARIFPCYKFRTMVRGADRLLERHLTANPAARVEWERSRKLEHDPRVTRIGAILRRTSLDELPQLFNVLRGEMALVGPRPITAEELQPNYGRRARWHYLRVQPGMTGLWQTSGRSRRSYRHRVVYDRFYHNHLNVGFDIAILLRTVRVVLRGDGAR